MLQDVREGKGGPRETRERNGGGRKKGRETRERKGGRKKKGRGGRKGVNLPA